MPRDIVVDTNVFVHAGNPRVKFFEGARRFMHALENTTVPLCVDKPREDAAPDDNTSLILFEYKAKVLPSSYGFAVLAKLASTKRIKWVSRDVGPAVNGKIRALVPSNIRDRTFLRVAYGSLAKIFVSDDGTDFSTPVRKRIAKQLSVRVEHSSIEFATL